MKTLYRSLLAFTLLALTGLGVNRAQAQHPSDIVDTAVAAGSFSTLAAALTEAGLVETLKGDGPFTVFAPTDEAFAALPAGTVENLLKPENRATLQAILTYHVVPGRVPAASVVELDNATTVNGQRVGIRVEDGKVFVGRAQVVKTDVMASNGIIHVIDQVLLPVTKTIPEVASEAGSFGTLLAAVKAAGLAEALMGAGPFTVFAPTDEAFAALPAGTVENLLKPENRATLQAILKYHVVPSRAYASDALAAGPLTTLEGGTVRVREMGGVVRVGDARVVMPNVDASNGVIHVIDAVLMPPQKTGALTPSDVVDLAVMRGVPLYNRGHHLATVAIYEVAAASLAAMDAVPGPTRTALRRALMTRDHDASARAWALRHALDDARDAMQSMAVR